ncbi:10658_t:CDS:2 [Funneliformis geosporum]|nr:10658_t:CDS:2 [Funneliformis geosporum]
MSKKWKPLIAYDDEYNDRYNNKYNKERDNRCDDKMIIYIPRKLGELCSICSTYEYDMFKDLANLIIQNIEDQEL